MNRLAPNLFDRRFGDLIDLGRSRLPSLAPQWTDHNAHDPGITLMELLAWVAEAQIYSLARMRRDERGAYAALVGLAASGTHPAHGLIWNDHDDPNSPSAMISRHFIIEREAAIHTSSSELPTFRPTHRILWIPARIRALVTHLGNGTRINHTGTNARGGPAFQPFGETADRNDVLHMDLETPENTPLIPPGFPDDARLIIGIRTDGAQGDSPHGEEWRSTQSSSPLEIMLSAGAERFSLDIVEDTSNGFMRTGVCVIDLSGVRIASNSITLEFRAPRGFDRAPRILRIEPNVIPIAQGSRIERELHEAQGVPDQSLNLESSGLQFAAATHPLKVEVSDGSFFDLWEECDRLSDCGPDDRVYELDAAAGRITFGNGINGSMPSSGAQIFVSYAVCDGEKGNTARNRKWIVQGVSGVFGGNPDPITGGRDPSNWIEQRREARGLVKAVHALVSPADIEAAALALPALEVARAWVAPPQAREAETGVVTLIAMQARPGSIERVTGLETPRWLEAIRRRLSPGMPLGSRLVVIRPRYVEFTIRCRVESEPGRDPASVETAVRHELGRRLKLAADGPGKALRAFGLAVTRRDMTSWLQALPEVGRVLDLQFRLAEDKVVGEVEVPRHGLPRIDLAGSRIEIVRGAAGGSR
jgi:predicted phage baseplate assembly protein